MPFVFFELYGGYVKEDGRTAHFYTLVSEGTDEQEFAFKRQLFLSSKDMNMK
jgi:hypothetical protein